jgi:hypothetical protein
MGVIQFEVERPDLLSSAHGLSLIDFLMYDGRVVPTHARMVDGLLRCERTGGESGQMRILWPRFDYSTQVAHTTCLREQASPYSLELELARGQISRLRNQLFAWQSAGLQTTPQLDQLVQESHRAFRSGVLRIESPETSSGAALVAIDLASRAADQMCQLYTEQRIGYRRSRSSRLPVFLGCQLQDAPKNPEAFCGAFDAVRVATNWNQLEHADGEYGWDRLDRLVSWAQDQKLFITGGPLVDLTQDHFPEWLRIWTGDAVNMQSFVSDFVETVVGRYVGRIRHWEVVMGANRGGVTELDEEQRLNLVARAIQAAKQVDEHVQISIRVVQPWGEYLSQTRNRLSPIQFVDTLRRCGIRMGEINLDIRVGSIPALTLWRDALSVSQLLDHWSFLQLPINVMLSLPSTPDLSADPEAEQRQADWLEQTVLMCLAKERVVGIYLSNWDKEPTEGVSTALIRENGDPRPALRRLFAVFEQFWG